MFRCAFVLLTAIAVLWHATAGCCAHHGHASAAATEATSCGCDSHACGEDAHPSNATDLAKHEHVLDAATHLQRSHDSSRNGCGERCSFPQPDAGGVELLKHSLAACDLSLPVATLIASWKVPRAEQESGFDAPPPSHVGHALRRHLALGVLLV